jgi:uncharacterized membrane protein
MIQASNNDAELQALVNDSLERIEDTLSCDSKKIETLNREVLERVKKNESVLLDAAKNKPKDPFGTRSSDFVARFGGSWPFVGIFTSAIIIWIIYNSVSALQPKADPYPFILLNLMLSCLAALQAPIILMSQNAQARRDREAALGDYRVNLKTEIELRLVHEKLDYLLTSQWKDLIAIQKIQLEMIESLQEKRNGKPKV